VPTMSESRALNLAYSPGFSCPKSALTRYHESANTGDTEALAAELASLASGDGRVQNALARRLIKVFSSEESGDSLG